MSDTREKYCLFEKQALLEILREEWALRPDTEWRALVPSIISGCVLLANLAYKAYSTASLNTFLNASIWISSIFLVGVIPPSSFYVLKNPKFIDFWACERRRNHGRKFVAILEDAESILMTRGSDNREEVSAILNISDGMLGNFLQLHTICTINCKATEIDAALLRPGRLLCHRVFGTLDYERATRLAVRLGRNLEAERDYTLAEVFAGPTSHERSGSPRIGFGI